MSASAKRRGQRGTAGWSPPAAPARKRRRDPLWARLVIVFGALLMMTSGGVLVGGKMLISSATGGIEQSSMLGSAAKDGKNSSINGALNILMLGIDQRQDNNEPIRADSIIVLHVPASHDQAYLVSLPRDLLVDIPPYPKTNYHGERTKINAAFAYGGGKNRSREGGFELLAMTISKLTGLKFDGGAIVDFGGFKKLVEVLGGINMCIDQRVVSHHVGYDKDGKFLKPFTGPNGETRVWASTPVVYTPGCRRLRAALALDYVRQRKGLPNGDYDRQRHQQQFLKAVLKEAKKQGLTTDIFKIKKMTDAAGKALTIDANGHPLEDWMFTLRNVTDNELVMLKTNGGKVNSVTVPGIGSCEQLTDESRAMFEAARSDTLAQFVLQHPNFVASDTLS